MKGRLIKYVPGWTGDSYFLGIIIDYLDGFHIRKSWSENRTFIKQEMIRVYWLNDPGSWPASAVSQIARKWHTHDQFVPNLVDNTNSVIDEWSKLNEEEGWYFPDSFSFLDHNDE